MDVDSGDVLALVSTPGFDPNAFNVGLSPQQWGDLTNNDYKPLINKVLSGAYPPGSTFKMVVALAALDAGVITPETTFSCSGAFRLGTHDFHCWKRGGHGTMNLRLGMKNSCDCYFYQVALKLGIDALQAGARRLGLGQATGIEIPGERSGFIPDRYWKQATFKEPWQIGETLVASIGQGYVLATPAAALHARGAHRERHAGHPAHRPLARRAADAAYRSRSRSDFPRRLWPRSAKA